MPDFRWQPPRPCYRAELPLDLPPSANVIYRSANGMSPLFCGSNLFSPGAGDGEYPSEDVVVVGDADSSEYLLAGALTCHRSMTYFTVVRHNNRTESLAVLQPEIRPGEEPEELLVLRGNDWRELLVQYAERVAAAMHARPIPPENLVGYCSWYYYYATVTDQTFLENIRALAAGETPFRHGIAQLDNGYQAAHGDWLTLCDGWQTPLAEIAEKTAQAGMMPGIWLAPLIASTRSGIFREHPDWFVRDDCGPVIHAGWNKPPENEWLCLDGSNPAVLEHLADLFRTMRGYGFRYFKLDALGYGMATGQRREPLATAVSAFRAMMRTIREAVPDCWILGCSSPFMPLLGIVDSCRVGCDTGPTWDGPATPKNCDRHPGRPCIRNAWHDTITNWWMFDRWFRCDPDCVMARQDHIHTTAGEARISTLGALLAGVAVTSDHFGTIAPERRELLELAARTRLHDVRPLDWVPDSWPHVFGGTVGERNALAFVNDCDQPLDFTPEQYGLRDRAVDLFRGREIRGTFQLPPHDAAFLVESGQSAVAASSTPAMAPSA